MKKLAILGLPVLALMSLTACNPDTEPKIDTAAGFDFVLNTPQLASQFIDLSTDGTLDFTVSQPSYGVTVAPTYGLEISLTPEFEPVTDEPVIDGEGEEHVVPGTYTLGLESQLYGVLTVKMSEIAAGINELNGAYDESTYTGDYVGPLYVRATAYLGSGLAAEKTAVQSNVITLAQVQGYANFGGAAEILLSVPGNANGWTHPGQVLYVGDSEDGTAMLFKGFAVVDGEFKLTDGDWDGSGNWGADDQGIVANGDGSFSGKLIQNSQSNFNGSGEVAAGLYYVYVELTDMYNGTDNAEVGKFTLIPITSVSLPGDYNGWDTNANMMTQNGDFATWTGSAGLTSAGWKFAMNGAWDINLGGTTEGLEFDGPNINLNASSVTLNLGQYPWTFTVE